MRLYDQYTERMRELSTDLIPTAAALLAEAFHYYAAHEIVCPDSSLRTKQLETLPSCKLRSQPDLSQSFFLVSQAPLMQHLARMQ